MNRDAAASRLCRAAESVRVQLLNQRNSLGHWEGRLSASPLSTATAVMALEQVRRQLTRASGSSIASVAYQSLIDGGLHWLARHQNADGGWGDTVKSFSNISTTMLAHAVFHATGVADRHSGLVDRARGYIDAAGGVPAVIARYGQDKTFSVPILTHCALAGLVDWKEIPPLPFELACISPRFYAAIQLPVVSYALPALIAMGQVRYHFRKPGNPLLRWLRAACIPRSLHILSSIQPCNGGFLEATPLTSFVTMSLAAKGLVEHPVTQRGVEFIVASVLPDGSWPIDTNLATWVTTLAVNALQDDLPAEDKTRIQDWLLGQQFRQRHPYTQASPGGWAWTDLPGGVPDADDTPGAILALLQLSDHRPDSRTEQAVNDGVNWLLELQNRDGGWPTFCRGWGALPFDRSSCDITAHCIRALHRTQLALGRLQGVEQAIRRGFRFLESSQRSDGSWLPLWFGNQHVPDESNPTYGTARVLAAYRETGGRGRPAARSGLRWLRLAQNSDGGWGGAPGSPSSVEETALAVEALTADPESEVEQLKGLQWLIERVECGRIAEPSPIGFYFAKLWYFEELYPLIFAVSALRCAAGVDANSPQSAV